MRFNLQTHFFPALLIELCIDVPAVTDSHHIADEQDRVGLCSLARWSDGNQDAKDDKLNVKYPP